MDLHRDGEGWACAQREETTRECDGVGGSVVGRPVVGRKVSVRWRRGEGMCGRESGLR